MDNYLEKKEEKVDEYEEIDLRDYIKVLWKRKWIVILATLTAVIGAGIMSFFVLKPVYQAKTVLLVPKSTPAVISKGMTIEEYINLQTLTPQTFSLKTYVGLLKSSSLEEKVINTLDLRTDLGEKLSPDALEKMMVAEPVKEADLIEMKVESSDPKIAKEIANTWVQLFVEENKKSSIQDTVSSESAIRSQFEIAKEELDKAEEEKKTFEEKNRILLLNQEINAKSSRIVEYKTKVSELERSILVEKAKMKELQAQLAQEENVILAQSVDNLTAGMSSLEAENFIKAQLEVAKERLDKAEEEKKAFEEKSKIPVLEKEVSNKINKIAEFKARLSEIDRSLNTIEAEIRIWLPELVNNEISAYESRLADIRLTQLMQEWETKEAGEELKYQSEMLTLRKSITEDQYLNQLLAELAEHKAISLSNLKLESEQVNPLYQNLKQRLINLNISQDVSKEETVKLETTIAKFKEVLAALSQQLLNDELDYQELISVVNSNLSKMRKVQLGSLRSPMAKELEKKLVNATVSIQSLLEEKKQLNENVREYSKELDKLRAVLETEKLKLTNLERAISVVKSTYNDLSQKFEQARIATSNKDIESKTIRHKNPIVISLEQKLMDSTVSLITKQKEVDQLNKDIDKFSQDIDALKKQLALESLQQTRIERKVSTVKSTYNMLSQKLEDARIASTIKTGEVRIVSLATEPRSPIRPRKKQNILIGGVLGIFVGVLGAFFVDYWKKDEKKRRDLNEQA